MGGGVHDPDDDPEGHRGGGHDEADRRPQCSSIPRSICCAPTACRTSGAPPAASARWSSASPRPSTGPGWTYDKMAIVSGIGCTGRVAGYVKLDSYHTTHGRADPLRHRPEAGQPRAEGGRLQRRRRSVGHRRQPPDPRRAAQHGPHGRLREQLHLRHDRRAGGARRRPDRRTPRPRPTGAFEPPFNLPLLLEACGACYVARWTCAARAPADQVDDRGPAQAAASPSSRSSRPARRSTPAATGWAPAST